MLDCAMQHDQVHISSANVFLDEKNRPAEAERGVSPTQVNKCDRGPMTPDGYPPIGA